jgi:ion channel
VLETTAAHVTVVVGTLAALTLSVLLQYEALILVWRRLSRQTGHRRIKVLYGILSVVLIHVLQIAIFGLTLWLLCLWPACGGLAGEGERQFFDYLYFSAVTFSTVGFGEVWPVGAIRFFCGIEALMGFVFIGWSASFTYIEMEQFWRPDELDDKK